MIEIWTVILIDFDSVCSQTMADLLTFESHVHKDHIVNQRISAGAADVYSRFAVSRLGLASGLESGFGEMGHNRRRRRGLKQPACR